MRAALLLRRPGKATLPAAATSAPAGVAGPAGPADAAAASSTSSPVVGALGPQGSTAAGATSTVSPPAGPHGPIETGPQAPPPPQRVTEAVTSLQHALGLYLPSRLATADRATAAIRRAARRG